jgi:outer membrane receptor for ferrienterochelin and colicin
MDGLKWRMDRGLGGEFILEDELESRGYPPVADALRTLPGVRVRGSGLFRQTVSLRNCTPAVYLDGFIAYKPESGSPMYVLSEVAPMDVEAIEVYKGAATLPPEFAGFGANCAVVIWTKRGR